MLSETEPEPEPESTSTVSRLVSGEQLIDIVGVVDAHAIVTHRAGDCIFIVDYTTELLNIRVLEIVGGGIQAIDGMPGSFEKYYTTIATIPSYWADEDDDKVDNYWEKYKQFFHNDFTILGKFLTDTLVNHCGSGTFNILHKDDTQIVIRVLNNGGLFEFEMDIVIRYNHNYMSIVSELKKTKKTIEKTIENYEKMINDANIEKERSDLVYETQIQELRNRLSKYEETSDEEDASEEEETSE
jgi:hypothetical protein